MSLLKIHMGKRIILLSNKLLVENYISTLLVSTYLQGMEKQVQIKEPFAANTTATHGKIASSLYPKTPG